jgi:hypothetical protein
MAVATRRPLGLRIWILVLAAIGAAALAIPTASAGPSEAEVEAMPPR